MTYEKKCLFEKISFEFLDRPDYCYLNIFKWHMIFKTRRKTNKRLKTYLFSKRLNSLKRYFGVKNDA
jgi:hypothetical protein